MGDPDRVKSVVRPRVLVVNDDSRLADSVRALLTEEGYDARCAADGQAALDALADWPADVILLDLIMPRLDGWAFLRRRVADPALTETAVVVWSGALPEELERARALGANACLPGGLTDPDRLLIVVKENVTGDRRMLPSAELPGSTTSG
jgi:two-component system, OmpR family, phosphate regulon response regulator PhoB